MDAATWEALTQVRPPSRWMEASKTARKLAPSTLPQHARKGLPGGPHASEVGEALGLSGSLGLGLTWIGLFIGNKISVGILHDKPPRAPVRGFRLYHNLCHR